MFVSLAALSNAVSLVPTNPFKLTATQIGYLGLNETQVGYLGLTDTQVGYLELTDTQVGYLGCRYKSPLGCDSRVSKAWRSEGLCVLSSTVVRCFLRMSALWIH